jgi:hypothetical protein
VILSSLLKLFFPSWRFFEEIGAAPRLHYRFASQGNKLGEWVLWQPKQTRKWNSLFLNAGGNLTLAYFSMIERLIQDSNDWDKKDPAQFADAVSYKLVEQFVRVQLRQYTGHARRFQFKVGTDAEDALISIEHGV